MIATPVLHFPPQAPIELAHDDWPRRAIRRFAVMLVGVTVLFLATEAVGLAGWVAAIRPVSFGDISGNILFAIGFGSPLILYLSSLPGWRSIGITAVLSLLVAAALWAVHRVIGPPQAVTALGIASIATMGLRAWRSRKAADRTDALLFLLPAAVSLVFTLEAGIFFELISSVFPLTYDPAAYAADAAYGFQPSFAVGRFFAALPWLKWVCFAIYVAPPPALVFVYALQARARPDRRPSVDVVTVLLALALIGYSAYFLYPITGPAAAFGAAFPAHPPVLDSLPFPRMPVGHAPRNGMPSLHMASVLLAYWHAKPFGRWARAVAAVFLAGTFLATIGLGEHYLVDLVVAMPFTLGVMAACTPARGPDRRRWRATAVVGCAALVVAWYGLLLLGSRGVLGSAWVGWPLTVLTAAAVIVMERHLGAAAGGLRRTAQFTGNRHPERSEGSLRPPSGRDPSLRSG